MAAGALMTMPVRAQMGAGCVSWLFAWKIPTPVDPNLFNNCSPARAHKDADLYFFISAFLNFNLVMIPDLWWLFDGNFPRFFVIPWFEKSRFSIVFPVVDMEKRFFLVLVCIPYGLPIEILVSLIPSL